MKNKEAQKLFKDNIKSIEIGTHNYCNRTCNFCPLSRDDVNRKEKKNTQFMDRVLFQNILEQLAEIDFDGRIDFSRYHEPLSHKKDILDRCRLVNYYIPNAKISINTNADYLDRQYIDELIECYVDNIAIQAYLKNGVVEYDEQGVFKRINQICKKINVPEINPDDYKDKDWIRYRLPEIKSTIHARNYWKNGMNRAGTVLDFNYKRTEPCTSMDKGVYIEYDGSMTACCDMLAPELHREWIVGDLKKESNIFLNYASEKYQGFKKRINNADWIENSPCIKCKRDIRGHKT